MPDYFPHTDIEKRAWGKAQLAERLGICRTTLWTYTKQIEEELKKKKGYNRYAKMLFPYQIELLLKHIGWS